MPDDATAQKTSQQSTQLPQHSPLRHPDIERDWLVRGIEQLQTYQKAEGHLSDALQALHEKRYLEALGFFRRALDENPQYPEVHFFLGITHFLLGQYQDAAERYRETVALESDHYGAHLQLGIVCHLLQKYPEAIAAFEQSTALNPSLSEAHVRLGNAHAAAGNRQQAVKAYAEALRIRLLQLPESEEPLSTP